MKPDRLILSVSAFLEGEVIYELLGERLFRRTRLQLEPDGERSAVPGTQGWLAFRRTLDQLQVWQWGRYWRHGGSLDGEQWALDIALGGREVRASGINAYPPSGHGPERSAEFSTLLTALETLGGFRLPPRAGGPSLPIGTPPAPEAGSRYGA